MERFLQQPPKVTRPPTNTPSREQGKSKRTRKVVEPPVPLVPVVMEPPTPTAEISSVVASKATQEWTTVSPKQPHTMATTKNSNLSDSDSDDDLQAEDLLPDATEEFVSDFMVRNRFTATLEFDWTDDPKQFLKQTVIRLNKIVRAVMSKMHSLDIAGKAYIIPWEDTKVFLNRSFLRVSRSIPHTRLLSLVKTLLFQYGSPQGKKQETMTIRKYCRLQLVWILDELADPGSKTTVAENFSFLVLDAPNQFHLHPAPSDAIRPTIAIQFRHSLTRNPSNWMDNGHDDCSHELNRMVRSFLPVSTPVGLKKAGMASGTPFMKGDPVLISLECEKRDEQLVIRDILKAFSSNTRKSQIQEKASVPWIPIPYFNSQDINGDKKYLPQYAELKAKEKLYLDNTYMRYYSDIINLDHKITLAKKHNTD